MFNTTPIVWGNDSSQGVIEYRRIAAEQLLGIVARLNTIHIAGYRRKA